MNLVDSCGWLEYLTDGPNADKFAAPLQDTENLVVPTICFYEVFKVVMRERGEEQALRVAALMQQGIIVDMNDDIAMQSAKISHDLKLPMADSIIIATARTHNATIWTQDSDFAKLPEANYIPKTPDTKN